jgi:amino acid adenylation domain-containing protein
MPVSSLDPTPRETPDNGSSQENTQQTHIAEMVSAQAVSRPEAIAVAEDDTVLTYRELDTRATDLAKHLRALGVGPNVVVGLCLPRSTAMVVGALGILKAGGAYLPLDPASPAARLCLHLNDAGVPVVVTGTCVADRLPSGSWRAVVLDKGGQQLDPGANSKLVEPLTGEVSGTDLAYVIYTSGSTGQPKGVEITHRSLENLVCWHQQAFGVTASDRATQQASPGFDAAVWELWPNLTIGASVHIPDDATRSDPERFRNWLIEHKVTITFVPTPMAEQFFHLEWPGNAALRVLLTGADTLRHYPPAKLPFAVVNNYGPTECTVVSTSATIPPNGRPDRLPSIGRPISNTQVYILDENLQPLPPGSPGELYIGGVGLARGYRNRPELTAERFVPNPFSSQPSSRLYKTGDVACYLPDGQIAFLGRNDDQVKIRGYRIELDEIVAAIDRHPMVQASAVIAREETPGDKRLVAYVVPKKETQLTDKVLREFLRVNLPEYMIPDLFCRLDVLPLTASGKIDRKALPPPSDLLSDEQYVAPRTAVELRVAGLLAALLRLEKVGIEDNFFLLGGNSLLGAQVVARVRDTFGIELTLLSLFDHPTVSSLSAEIERLLMARLDAMSEDEAERLAAGSGLGANNECQYTNRSSLS